ncbi:(d)CMP kinase [soil metagenome]|jgi:cytidylate kinase|nr:(d)CMP kinase [Deinococcota bacterium]
MMTLVDVYELSGPRPVGPGCADGADDERRLVITLDGPAASGKSSVARRVAELLNIPYVSSGLLYRAATFLVLERGLGPADEAAVMALLNAHRVELRAQTGRANQLFIDAVNISPALHTDAVDAAVSAVAGHPSVRDWVGERLRATGGSFAIDGRDMGTAVFPDATHKFYLDAPAEVRARRRVGERSTSLPEVAEALRRRDRLDHKQLTPAPDAVHIDTADLTVEEVTRRVLDEVLSTSLAR